MPFDAFRCHASVAAVSICLGVTATTRPSLEGDMPIARYFVERLTAHSDVWMVKYDDEEHGPYKSQSEAVHFAIDAAEKLNKHARKPKLSL